MSTAYEAYLRSPRWREVRNTILARDKGLCQKCKLARATEVHHRRYDRLGRERPDDLVSLCRRCHLAAHGIILPEPPIPGPGFHR